MNRQALPGPARLLLLMAGCFLKESVVHKVLVTAAMFFLMAVPACAAIEPQSWQFNKQVQAQKDGFALIELDAEVLGHTRDDLADIRLSDEAGQEVPYQLLQPEFNKEETFPVQPIDNVVRENEFSSVTLDLQTGDHRHNRIQLDLESKEDYLRDVKIEGSADNRTWNLISSQKVFYVSPNYRQNDLFYPTASFRYMRVTIDSKGKNPLNIRGAKVKYVQDAGGLPLVFKGPDGPPAALQETGDAARHADSTSARAGSIIPSTLLSSQTDTRTNQTELIIDLGTKGYQIYYIALQVDGSNFNRLINYYDTNDNRWRHLGQERIYHYQWPDYEASKNTLLLNRSGARFIKLVLYNQDSPPLNVEGVTVWGDHPKILADLRQGNYTLWYGNSNSKAPQYDLSQFAQMVDKSQLAVLQSGHESVNANYRPKLTDNRWFLNIVTVLAALAIGLLILKNMKRKGN